MTPGTAARQAPLSMGILKARILEWVAMPSSGGGGGLPNPGIEPRSPILQVDSLRTEPPGKPKNLSLVNLFFFFFLNNIVFLYIPKTGLEVSFLSVFSSGTPII